MHQFNVLIVIALFGCYYNWEKILIMKSFFTAVEIKLLDIFLDME